MAQEKEKPHYLCNVENLKLPPNHYLEIIEVQYFKKTHTYNTKA
jgi:hypothetical protein